MSARRPNISVLVGGTWLYGRVTPGEFSKAIAGTSENHRTFRLNKGTLRGDRSVIVVKGSRVDAWDWLTPEPPARRKARAKPAAQRVVENGNGWIAPPNLTGDQRVQLAADTVRLSDETITMLCIAANVNTVDDLTQASLPAFQEALAAHVAGAVA